MIVLCCSASTALFSFHNLDVRNRLPERCFFDATYRLTLFKKNPLSTKKKGFLNPSAIFGSYLQSQTQDALLVHATLV
jgi:hypothetical protein